jgi:hypothetical protein
MARVAAKAFMARTGRGLKVRAGARSCAQQDAIYAQGRTTPGAVVTNAPGCRSWHVTGLAIDVDPVDLSTGQIVPNGTHPDYVTLGEVWERLGGVWGGRFRLYDPGHLEWHPGLSIDEVCPAGTTCSQFSVSTRTPGWAWAASGLAMVGVGLVVWGSLRALR